ncbi:MAG: cytidine deaminase, partial [Gammaproteobacteria bacterium]|nr:cytidine deaminase [Gammaproteobacteria bacterium]
MADDARLLERARAVRLRAYAPFSGYRVGAAVVDENGDVYTGCNVENSSYPVGTCAESNAVGAMIAAGGTQIKIIAIVGGHEEPEACTPCGACRQTIAEFAADDARILLLDAS